MTGCRELSERMPAVAHGRSVWSQAEQDHLAGCSDCESEWRLVSAAAVLGVDVSHGLAAGPIAEGVADGLRRRAAVHRLRVRPAGWLTAAAVAALLLLAVLTRPVLEDGVEPPPPPALLPEIRFLDAQGLQAMLESLPPATTWSSLDVGGGGLADLTEEELERLLRSLEG